MKTSFLILALFATALLHGQFYYKDILGAKEMSDRQQLYVSQKIATATVMGFDASGRQTSAFGELREIKENGAALQITTRNENSKAIVYFRFNNQHQLLSINDSAAGSGSKTIYQYDVQNRVKTVQNFSTDPIQGFDQVETHEWFYAADNKPEKMIRIVNKTDSTEYRFSRDENGNVADEQVYRRNRKFGEPYYYYYNDDKLLSDIVRFDKFSNGLMPELLFEYDESKRMVQKMVVTSNINKDYLIWRYIYNEKGLYSKEVLFNKQKQITAKFEYSYTFRP